MFSLSICVDTKERKDTRYLMCVWFECNWSTVAIIKTNKEHYNFHSVQVGLLVM